MTSTEAIHACNGLLDWLSVKTQTPETARMAAAIASVKAIAIADVSTEIATK
jgi:hypothetical protein